MGRAFYPLPVGYFFSAFDTNTKTTDPKSEKEIPFLLIKIQDKHRGVDAASPAGGLPARGAAVRGVVFDSAIFRRMRGSLNYLSLLF